MAVQFHPLARERMEERGATEEEIRETIDQGEQFPAKFGRTGFRRNFACGGKRRGKASATKQIEAIAVREGDDWLVLTAITRYF